MTRPNTVLSLAYKFEPPSQGAPASPVELARTCLKAHQTLIALNPENAQRFKEVAQFKPEDLHRLEIGENRWPAATNSVKHKPLSGHERPRMSWPAPPPAIPLRTTDEMP